MKWSYRAARIDEQEHAVGAILGSDRVILSTSSRVVVLRLSDGLPLSEYAPVDSAGASGIPAPRLHWLSTPVLGADGTIYVADPGLRVLVFRDTSAK